MAFPPAFLDEIRARVPLVGVVGRRVRLAKRGREHTGLCPFHKEKTPSFTVSEDKGFYHCFGCGAHGDVIGFVMQAEGLSFPESVEKLAAEAGLEVPRHRPQDPAAERRRADLYEVLEEATGWFESQLAAVGGSEARAYLERRGLSAETIASFRLGYAPNRRGGLRQALKAKGISDDLLEQAGLIKRPDVEGGSPPEDPRDYFFNRVIFPITDRRGRVIAFGGRALGDSPAKYLNSPETPLFHKGSLLFNLARARSAARGTVGLGGGELLVAEGYMDVIALSQAGFTAAVAPLGTAITEQQLAELWRIAREPLLCLDGDSAGKRAAFRAIERALPLLRPGQTLRFALLPEGEDPDSLVRRGGVPALRACLEQAQPLAAMLWAWQTHGGRFDTPERRAALWKGLSATLGQIRDTDLQEAFRVEMAERFAAAFGYRPDGRRGGRMAWRGPARRDLGGRGKGAETALAAAAQIARRPPQGLRRRHEQLMLRTLINHPVLLAEGAEDLASIEVESADLRQLLAAVLDLVARLPDLDSDALKCHLSQLGFSGLLDDLFRRRVLDLRACERPETPLAKVRSQWNQFLADTQRRKAEAETEEMGRRLAADMSEENLLRLQAKQRLSGGDGGRKADVDGLLGAESYESE